MTYTPSLFVDADACPVKEECIACASHFRLNIVFVASMKNMTNNYPGTKWVYVDWDKEAADLYIMNHSRKGDIAVTADIGLAATLLGKGVSVISPRGILYNESNIDSMLFMRHESAKKRRQGIHSKGPKSFTVKDRENFCKTLMKKLSNFEGI